MDIQINPFEDDIVIEPRNVKESVTSLNEHALNKLLNNFSVIASGQAAKESCLNHAFLILSAEPGNGKSHLIGRMFHVLKETSTLVYIRPFENVSTCWKSILLKIVQELCFPDILDQKAFNQKSPTQLEAFSHGILENLLSEAIANGLINVKYESFIKKIREKGCLHKYLNDTEYANWILSNTDKFAVQFAQMIESQGITLNASALSWIKVLLNYACNRQKIEIRETCLEWLKGECVDHDEAKALGIRNKDTSLPHMTNDETNELCKLRILDLCHLATFFRPFLFCFDQTENYGKSSGLVKTFGIVIENLIDACPNQMTIVTANLDVWKKSFLQSLEVAHTQRFSSPIELEGINKEQGKELVKQRVTRVKTNKDFNKFISSDIWLNNLFKNKPQIGIRRFINICRDQWDKGKSSEIEGPSISNYFERKINAIKAQPKRHVFEPDILYWMIFEVAKCVKGITVKQYSTEKGYFTVQWLKDRHSILFGFESGSNCARWQAIAREAKRYFAADKCSKALILRTFELPKIPKPTWKNIGPEIESVIKECLRILYLKKDMLIEIYAANELYRDAVEGDIPNSINEVLDFISARLKWFWDTIINGSHGEKEYAKANSDINCTENIINEIRVNIKREKLLSIDELMDILPESINNETIFSACKKIPQIKIYKSPEIAILQWQSNQ